MTDSEAIQYLDSWLEYHLNPNPSWDSQIRAGMQDLNVPEPVYCFVLFGITFFVWKKPEMRLELVETYPYAPDGEYPTMMLQIGWVELMFDSKLLYKFI